MIKLRGCLGGHCLNIGTSKATPIIGAIGRSWTNFGIRITSQAFKEVILNMFHFPIPSGETNLERRRPGGKSRRPFRAGRTHSFD